MNDLESQSSQWVRLALIAAVVVLAVAGLLALSSNSAGETNDTIAIDRAGDNVTVTVENEEFTTLVVQVKNDGEILNDTRETVTAERVDRAYSLYDLDLPADENLSQATVFVELLDENDDSVGNESEELDLRAVQFDQQYELIDGELNITAASVVGVGSELDGVVGGINWTFAVTGSNPAALSTDLSAHTASSHGVPIHETTVRVLEGTDGASTVTINLSSEATEPVVTADDEMLSYEHELLIDGGEYDVFADGQRIENVTVDSYGELQVPENATAQLLTDGTGELTVAHDGQRLASPTTVSVEDEQFRELAWEMIRPEAAQVGESFEITHPALIDGEEYVVYISTDDTEREETVTADDGVTIPQPDRLAVVPATDLSLQITEAQRDVGFTGTPDFSPVSANATIEEGTLSIDQTDESLNLSDADQLWLDTTSGVEQIHDDRLTDRQANLTGLGVAIETNGTVGAVLIEGATITRLELAISDVTEPPEPTTETTGLAGPLQLNVDSQFLGISTLLLVVLGAASVGVPRITDEIDRQQLDTVVAGLGYTIGLAIVLYTFVEPGYFGLVWTGGTIAALALTGLTVVSYLRSDGPSGLLLGVGSGIVVLGLLIILAVLEQRILGLVVGGVYGLLGGGFVIAYGELVVANRAGIGGQTVTAPVVLRDEQTGHEIQQSVALTFHRPHDDRQITADGYREQVSLPPGDWDVIVRAGNDSVRTACQVHLGASELVVPVPSTPVEIRVTASSGEPVRGAAVTVESPDESGEWHRQITTDGEGTATAQVPFGIDHAAIRVDHERYEPATYRIDTRQQEFASIELYQRTGTLVATARLGEDPVPGVTVTATPQDGRTQPTTGTTNEYGEAVFDALPVGEYSLSAEPPGDPSVFTVRSGVVAVEENIRRDGYVDLSFEYQLTREVRDRISTLRSRLDELASSSRRDDAIQYYYASVLHAVLDLVDDAPRAGYAFLEHDADPATVVDALLRATESMVAMLENVLSSKRNVNLFSACSDLPPAEVQWSGARLEEFLTQADQDLGAQRGAFNDRLEAVDERITDELRTLAEVSPAREVWEGTRNTVSEQSDREKLELTASLYVGFLLLDAIESLFEDDRLRQRLEQTVY